MFENNPRTDFIKAFEIYHPEMHDGKWAVIHCPSSVPNGWWVGHMSNYWMSDSGYYPDGNEAAPAVNYEGWDLWVIILEEEYYPANQRAPKYAYNNEIRVAKARGTEDSKWQKEWDAREIEDEIN